MLGRCDQILANYFPKGQIHYGGCGDSGRNPQRLTCNGARILFKINFEKDFDKIKWPFLVQVLEIKGFPHKFGDMVMHIVLGGKLELKLMARLSLFLNAPRTKARGPVVPFALLSC